MNKRFASTLIGLFAAAALTAPAVEAATTYTLDRSHSNVEFSVRHLMSKVRGSFNDFAATVVMDDDPAKSSVEFTIQATSIDTGNGDRDNHLRSGDFFDVANQPTIRFKSSSVKKTGANSYDVTGELTMRGVAKVITLPVSFLGEMKDPRGKSKVGFETATRLNRKEYGINWNRALDQGGFLLADEVDVEIGLQFQAAK